MMFSLVVTCMVNIPFKNGLSTKKDKKQQQILQIIPNLKTIWILKIEPSLKHYAVSCQNFCIVESNAVCSQSIMGQEAAVVSNDMENCSENLYMSQINNCDKLYKFEPV